jgi:hypothetical protein
MSKAFDDISQVANNSKKRLIPYICSPMLPLLEAPHSAAFPLKSPANPVLPVPPDVSKGLALAERTSMDNPNRIWVFKRVELATNALLADVEERAERANERFTGRLATRIRR